MCGSYTKCLTNDFAKRIYGNVVSSGRQSTYNDLYFYTYSWAMCHYGYLDYRSESEYPTHIYTRSTKLCWYSAISFANDFAEWVYGYLVSSS